MERSQKIRRQETDISVFDRQSKRVKVLWLLATFSMVANEYAALLTTQWTRMLRGIQKMRENTTTEPTMLSARNFPEGGGVGVQKERRSPCDFRAFAGHSPNVLMSSLSMKSHNLSITSCTCFMHFPCSNRGASTDDMRREPENRR